MWSHVNRAESAQRYRRNTAIVETELADRDGNRLLVTDTVPRFRRLMGSGLRQCRAGQEDDRQRKRRTYAKC